MAISAPLAEQSQSHQQTFQQLPKKQQQQRPSTPPSSSRHPTQSIRLPESSPYAFLSLSPSLLAGKSFTIQQYAMLFSLLLDSASTSSTLLDHEKLVNLTTHLFQSYESQPPPTSPQDITYHQEILSTVFQFYQHVISITNSTKSNTSTTTSTLIDHVQQEMTRVLGTYVISNAKWRSFQPSTLDTIFQGMQSATANSSNNIHVQNRQVLVDTFLKQLNKVVLEYLNRNQKSLLRAIRGEGEVIVDWIVLAIKVNFRISDSISFIKLCFKLTFFQQQLNTQFSKPEHMATLLPHLDAFLVSPNSTTPLLPPTIYSIVIQSLSILRIPTLLPSTESQTNLLLQYHKSLMSSISASLIASSPNSSESTTTNIRMHELLDMLRETVSKTISYFTQIASVESQSSWSSDSVENMFMIRKDILNTLRPVTESDVIGEEGINRHKIQQSYTDDAIIMNKIKDVQFLLDTSIPKIAMMGFPIEYPQNLPIRVMTDSITLRQRHWLDMVVKRLPEHMDYVIRTWKYSNTVSSPVISGDGVVMGKQYGLDRSFWESVFACRVIEILTQNILTPTSQESSGSKVMNFFKKRTRQTNLSQQDQITELYNDYLTKGWILPNDITKSILIMGHALCHDSNASLEVIENMLNKNEFSLTSHFGWLFIALHRHTTRADIVDKTHEYELQMLRQGFDHHPNSTLPALLPVFIHLGELEKFSQRLDDTRSENLLGLSTDLFWKTIFESCYESVYKRASLWVVEDGVYQYVRARGSVPVSIDTFMTWTAIVRNGIRMGDMNFVYEMFETRLLPQFESIVSSWQSFPREQQEMFGKVFEETFRFFYTHTDTKVGDKAHASIQRVILGMNVSLESIALFRKFVWLPVFESRRDVGELKILWQVLNGRKDIEASEREVKEVMGKVVPMGPEETVQSLVDKHGFLKDLTAKELQPFMEQYNAMK